MLAIPEQALEALGFGEARPSTRKLYADGKYVVFPFSAYVESTQLAAGIATASALSKSECWSAANTC